MTSGSGDQGETDVVVVGAGFAGLYALFRLRSLGYAVQAVELGSDVGGTWYWNCYPGARCDVESLEYCFSFDDDLQSEWRWSERYASQAELQRYLSHVADRFALRALVTFGERVVSAHFNDDSARWDVTAESGRSWRARFVIMATGPLSVVNPVTFPGRDEYEGRVVHTARWPREGLDLSGAVVGVVGTGSSAVQAIPRIAASAERLVVFQRTPAYVVPGHNGPIDPEFEAFVRADYPGFRERNRRMPRAFASHVPPSSSSAQLLDTDERERELDRRWSRGGLTYIASFADVLVDPESNRIVAEYVRRRIREAVADPATAALLSPRHTIGCKRLCVEDEYYATFNRPNVTLVDVSSSPVERFTNAGLVAGGASWALDVVVLATGFDALTGALTAIDIRGRAGVPLSDLWRDGPATYLGLSIPGLPNLFMVNGPGSPSVLTNMVMSIEHHVEWITECIDRVVQTGALTIEPSPSSAAAWMDHVAAQADPTLFSTCNSWFIGANVPGKPRTFMPLLDFPPYVDRCAEVVRRGYEGFAISPGSVLLSSVAPST